MVIKASSKTMAKQRKDAISNWKVSAFVDYCCCIYLLLPIWVKA